MILSNYTKEFTYNWKLAYPVILGMLGHTFVSLVDNIMVGKIGPAELAAVSLGNSFTFIAMSLGIGFSTAITPLVAAAHAEGSFRKTKNALKHGLFLCTLIAVIVFAGVMICKPLLANMRQPDEVVILAIPYLEIVAFSLIPLIMFQAFKQFADGMSKTKYAMWATIMANVLNVILNYLLIFGKLGFPELGVIGAGIGTLISRIAMLIFIWLLLKSKEKFKPYVTGFKFSEIKKSILKKIISLGFPSALQMFFEVAIFTAAIWLSGILGKNAQAANQIALNLSSMTFMVAMGLSVAAMIRVGNQKGLKAFGELRRIALSIFLFTVLLEIVFAAIFLLFNTELPKLYPDLSDEANLADNLEVIAIAAKLLLIAAFFQFSDGIQVVVLGALRGMQDVWIPSLITFIAYWVVGFPISYYLGLHTEWKSSGIWLGLLAGLTTSAILLYIRFNYLSKKLIR
ncbi:MAG: MATE family efflux transporter [Flavobacteriaceae bacterium]|nr:MATE family efflux transporter [Flavobacteriaceae bacterium]